MLSTAPALRTAALSCRIQPTVLTPCTYHTSTPSPIRSTESSTTITPRRVYFPKRNVTFKQTSQTVRRASSASSASGAAASSAQGSDNKPTELLDWNTFFRLRRKRRLFQLTSSVTTSAMGFVSGASLITSSNMDALVSQLPLDPFISLGLMTFTCAGAGWLVGPIVGTGIFNLQNRKFRSQMDKKEKEFYRRIKQYRVDPSASSMANPVPGELWSPKSENRGVLCRRRKICC
jgi:mitochondrial import inner membrane translocase subunit TIM23